MGREGSGGPSYGTVGSGGVERPSMKVQEWLGGTLEGWEASRKAGRVARSFCRAGRVR